MDSQQTLLVFLLIIISASASHYRGGSLSWSIRDNATMASSSEVILRISQRHSYRRTYSADTFCNQTTIAAGGSIGAGYVTCLGNCSGSSSNGSSYSIPMLSTYVPCTDFSNESDYSSGEGTVDVVVPKDIRFVYAIQSCCWIQTLQGGNDWSLVVIVDTHRRRNGRYNSSPKTASSPVVQVQLGRTHVIPIPMADSDGDGLRCRWGNTKDECGDICSSKGTLQSFPCQLTYQATTLGYEAVALIIEDYDPITNETFSAIPLQFLIRIVDQTQTTVLPTWNYTGPPPLSSCNLPPEYVGDRQHGACIGIASNTTITERIVVKVPCQQSNTIITDILTVSPSGLTKGPITIDPNNNDTYIMFIQWTPRPDQYGIHQLCLTPVDSIGQNGQQVCYTFQVDALPPQFVNGSMTPRGSVSRSQAVWSISTDGDIVPPLRKQVYIRFFKRVIGGTDREVLRVDTATNVIYQTRQIHISTGNVTWEPGAHYYILLDSGVASVNRSCGIESSPVISKQFWEFWIERISTTRSTVTTTRSTKESTTTEKPTTVSAITTATTKITSTTSTAVTMATTYASTTTASTTGPPTIFCPHWLPFGTVLNLTTSALQPNYTFCFRVNTTFADVTIAANTWAPCLTWKISGTADPFLEMFTPETSTGPPVAQNDDGNSISHLNCFAAVLSYRLKNGSHRVVIRHQKCAYGNFELRLSSETTNELK